MPYSNCACMLSGALPTAVSSTDSASTVLPSERSIRACATSASTLPGSLVSTSSMRPYASAGFFS